MKYKLTILEQNISVVLSDLATVMDFVKQMVIDSDKVQVIIEKLGNQDENKTFRNFDLNK